MLYKDQLNRPIWAPWRIEYILNARADDEDCFVCAAANAPDNDHENHVVRRGKEAFVILNRYPYNPGHVLVSPYRHVGDLTELTPDERHEVFDLVVEAEGVIRTAMQPDGFNQGCNLGKVAGAGLEDHVHLHLVPRWNGDTNFMPVLGKVDCVPQALTAAADLLREAWTGRLPAAGAQPDTPAS